MRARVLTALALIPPVLAALFCTDEWPLLVLSLILLWLGAQEIDRMIKGKFALPGALIHIALGFASAWLLAAQKLDYRFLATSGAISLALGLLGARMAAQKGSSNLLLDFLAGGWIAGPLLCIAALHVHITPPWWNFQTPVLLAIVPLWAGDTAAIFAGKAFGKHPLAPKISPKKTVEGGIANLVACILAAWGLGTWIGTTLPQSLACGAAAGILGQCGDLFESWVKRKADLKDSGTLLPGHGGIMDRIDSILFTAPAVALILLM